MARRLRGVLRVAPGIGAVLSLAACATSPIALSSQFSPPSQQAWLGKPATSDRPCRVRIAAVRDLRTDPEAMGVTGLRLIRSADAAAWVRSGFVALGHDRRLQIVDDAAQGDVVMDVEILKAYAMSVTGETRAASVVLRVHYSRDGAPAGEQIYRGTENGLNWSSGEGETQSSFDAALADLLKTVDSDLVARCKE
jgi:hypothetical protein